ncbi:5571_t:CDS:2 [Funneliformis mosseae]|uniref:5571_t:CDS:1 n=1 Tax=Funneliformis mosseae TaxID=27381 RepID=A0A9N9GGR5_FUNMO|nr:5571_t:CDS:2 [Funneliformis mosseae]
MSIFFEKSTESRAFDAITTRYAFLTISKEYLATYEDFDAQLLAESEFQLESICC